jgi:uncharacterized membrane protein
MTRISPTLLVAVAVVLTALAQVLLKKAADYEVRTTPWVMLFTSSGLAYVASFVLYSQILKYFALNKIYPAMTVAQILVITLCGYFLGEAVGGRHALGLALGTVAIYLILA